MLIIHDLCTCEKCDEPLEIFTEDIIKGVIYCPVCNSTTDLSGSAIHRWEEEW